MDTNDDGNSTTPNYYDWSGIRFFDTSDDGYNELNHFIIKHCNSYNLSFDNANGLVKNGEIFNNGTGIALYGASATIVDSVLISNCLNDPLAMSLQANPSFTNIEFVSNGSNGIRILEENLSQSAVLDKRSVAGFPNIAYILRKDLVISTNSVLTINPGVVVKMNIPYSSPTCECIDVQGGLKIKGTESENVVITSFGMIQQEEIRITMETPHRRRPTGTSFE